MTNPLIPNTFVPGTKAKAQEVNENFIALAEEIQGTQFNTSEQFVKLRSEIDEKMDTVAQNYALKDFTNTNSITNTILEALNGVAEHDGQTITVKSGVRVLIPNGITEEGKLDNIDFTTEGIISKTVTNLSDVDTIVFLNKNDEIEIIPQENVNYSLSTPSSLVNNSYWYSINENKWYKYISSESQWVQVFVTPIANAVWNSSSTISSLKVSQPINLLKTSDLNSFYTLKGMLPKDMDYVVQRYSNVWKKYSIYKSGWVEQSGYSDGSGDTTINLYIPMEVPYSVSVSRLTSASNTTNVPLWFRGDQTTTYMKIYSNSSTGKIWTVSGYRAN